MLDKTCVHCSRLYNTVKISMELLIRFFTIGCPTIVVHCTVKGDSLVEPGFFLVVLCQEHDCDSINIHLPVTCYYKKTAMLM